MNIISASRRTDIPAFYAPWFMNRIKEGYAIYRNPFGGQEHRVSLLADDVHSIVFWSKNYGPLMQRLPELESKGYHFCFHFTITGLPLIFEANVPEMKVTVDQFRRLAGEYGSRRAFWRYDPILFSDVTETEYHLKTFSYLAGRLRGHTRRCYISFTQFYSKVKRNALTLLGETGIRCYDPSLDEKLELVAELSEIAHDNDIMLLSCCSDYLVGGQVAKGSCIDGALLRELFPDKPFNFKTNPTRDQCACTDSRDIGAYDTCPHGCVYCYANANREEATRRQKQHNEDSELLACRVTPENETINRTVAKSKEIWR